MGWHALDLAGDRSGLARTPNGVLCLSISGPVGIPHLAAVLARTALSPAAAVEQVGTDATGWTRLTPVTQVEGVGWAGKWFMRGEGGAGCWEEGGAFSSGEEARPLGAVSRGRGGK